MNFKFENLEVWKLALDFLRLVKIITAKFPSEEKFILVSQMNRAALSISLNIAEGSGRKTKKDFANFIRISLSSLLEVVACERVASAQEYLITQVHREEFAEKSKELYFKLIALEKYLRK
jgi:four helix bundle protein